MKPLHIHSTIPVRSFPRGKVNMDDQSGPRSIQSLFFPETPETATSDVVRAAKGDAEGCERTCCGVKVNKHSYSRTPPPVHVYSTRCTKGVSPLSLLPDRNQNAPLSKVRERLKSTQVCFICNSPKKNLRKWIPFYKNNSCQSIFYQKKSRPVNFWFEKSIISSRMKS